jgi:hypothetical protein
MRNKTMTEQLLKTNHDIRIVNLTTKDSVLCMFGEVRNDEQQVVGYRMLYPFTLSLGDVNEDGTMPINYSRFCPFSPVEEHRMGGEHILTVVYPDNGILGNYVAKLKELGLTEEQIFFEEKPDGNNSEPDQAAE